jgi:hypothetical protein
VDWSAFERDLCFSHIHTARRRLARQATPLVSGFRFGRMRRLLGQQLPHVLYRDRLVPLMLYPAPRATPF